MRDILSFHAVNGKSITLSNRDSCASRSQGSNSDGIVFSSQPISVNQRASIQITSINAELFGTLHIGLTSVNPAEISDSGLPPFLLPNFHTANAGGCWTRPLERPAGLRGPVTTLKAGSVVTVYLNDSGSVYWIVDDELKGTLIRGVPLDVQLWLVIDVYGSVTSIRLIRSVEGPVEILSRGLRALRSYQRTCETSGAHAVRRRRLVLLGAASRHAHRKLKLRLLSLISSFSDSERPLDSSVGGSLRCSAIDLTESYSSMQGLKLNTWRVHLPSPARPSTSSSPYPPEEHSIYSTVDYREELEEMDEGMEVDNHRDIHKGKKRVGHEEEEDTQRKKEEEEVVLAMNLCLLIMEQERRGIAVAEAQSSVDGSSVTASHSETSSESLAQQFQTSKSTQVKHLTDVESLESINTSTNQMSSILSVPKTNHTHKLRLNLNQLNYANHPLLAGKSERVIGLVEKLMSGRGLSTPTVRSVKVQDTATRLTAVEAESNIYWSTNSKQVLVDIVECESNPAYFMAHKVYLSNRSIYLLTFDLSKNLEASVPETDTQESSSCSQLDTLHYWLSTIHAFVAGPAPATSSYPTTAAGLQQHQLEDEQLGAGCITLRPLVMILGICDRRDLPSDFNSDGHVSKMAEEKFTMIASFIRGKAYESHVMQCYHYLISDGEEISNTDQLQDLQKTLQQTILSEELHGDLLPDRWIRFEAVTERLLEGGAYICIRSQMEEVIREEMKLDDIEMDCMLRYHEDRGLILLQPELGGSTGSAHPGDLVVLHPHWVVLKTAALFDPGLISSSTGLAAYNTPALMMAPGSTAVISVETRDSGEGGSNDSHWYHYRQTGILSEAMIDSVWAESLSHKYRLLSLLTRLELLNERSPGNISSTNTLGSSWERRRSGGRSFLVPGVIDRYHPSDDLHRDSYNAVIFYFNFTGSIPDVLFHRLLVRTYNWSRDTSGLRGGGHVMGGEQVYRGSARYSIDSEHDLILSSFCDINDSNNTSNNNQSNDNNGGCLTRIKVTILRIVDVDQLDDDDSSIFDNMEETISVMPKSTVIAKVRNFLEHTLCELRETWILRMRYDTCVRCMCEKVCAAHMTSACAQQQCLHFLSLDECLANKIVFCDHRRIRTAPYTRGFPLPQPPVQHGPIIEELAQQDINSKLDLPSWVKNAAKMLNGGVEGHDWTALAKKLGYRKQKIEKISYNQNPGLALISDWIISSGNTSLSVDLLITYLEQLQRDDIVDIILKGQEQEAEPPQVFLSYQWDSQDEVTLLRDYLEVHGLTCWMDIGQMGGGDLLYSKIYEGIKTAKVTIACLTPKYIVSHHCCRELSLADLLHKPIIPVMMQRIPWPPSGSLSLILSQHVYINLKGVGGHGGSGLHADIEAKYQEILTRACNYATPNSKPYVKVTARPATKSLLKKTFLGGRLGNSAAQDRQGAGPARSETRPPPAVQPVRGSDSGRGRSQGRAVEEANVRQCAVCTIL